MSNSFGNIIRLTTFGESHGPAIGGILDGVPSKLNVDINAVQAELDKRKPGLSSLSSPRKESDRIQILSGLMEGQTLGTPIAFQFLNEDKKSEDYDDLKSKNRPSHADYSILKKYGIRDHRGGARSSARETASWVAAGSIVAGIVKQVGIEISSYVSNIGGVEFNSGYNFFEESEIYSSEVRCPDPESAREMEEKILKAKDEKDSLGGQITCVIRNVPPGLGEPIFDKLDAALGKAMLGINAVKGVEFGSGFGSASMKGSEHNDEMKREENKAVFITNNSGGILGGISSGADICFRIAFKPTATIGKKQSSIDDQGENIKIEASGRHDPCVVPRAVPIVKGLSNLVMADFIMLNKLAQLSE